MARVCDEVLAYMFPRGLVKGSAPTSGKNGYVDVCSCQIPLLGDVMMGPPCERSRPQPRWTLDAGGRKRYWMI